MGKRLIPQRRARGGSHYRSPSHRHVDDIRIPHYEAEGTIKDLIQAPGRTSPLAGIDFEGKRDGIADDGIFGGHANDGVNRSERGFAFDGLSLRDLNGGLFCGV